MTSDPALSGAWAAALGQLPADGETAPAQDGGASQRLLALLEGECAPLLGGRKAKLRDWDRRPYEILGAPVVLPSWNWTSPHQAEGERLVTLDANGAWLAAAASCSVAWGPLVHAGPAPLAAYTRTRAPGYYLTTVPVQAWCDTRIVHPLGTAKWDGHTVWLPEPVFGLLAELHAQDAWPEPPILDAWVGEGGRRVRLTRWTSEVQRRRVALKERAAAGDDQAEHDLAALKIAYAQAVQMMHGPLDGDGKPRCLLRRPDWQDAVKGMHAANMWRKAWKATKAGFLMRRMGHVDTLTVTRADLLAMHRTAPPVLRLDQSGLALGAFKIIAESEPEAGR